MLPFESAKRRVIAQDVAAQQRDCSHMPKISTALRVLIVDDEPLIRWSMAETLTGRGHEVVEAGDGRSAIAAVSDAATPFDVVLLDFRLPDSHDLTLLSRLRHMTPQTKIVMMTAYGTAELVRGASELGVFRVVGKPFEIDELASLIQDAHAAGPA
jgi:two-component system response regulator AtoC